MENKLEELISKAIEEQTDQPAPVKPVKKERTPAQIAALEKGRATRAKNLAGKKIIKEQKMRMLEKIHERVESMDMDKLMKKMEELARAKQRATSPPLVKEKKTISTSVEIDPPTPPEEEEEQEEEQEQEEEAWFFDKKKKTFYI